MSDSSQSILTVLTGDCWWHNDLTSLIRFFPDGTGRLFFGGEITPVFAQGFDWKALNSAVLEETLRIPESRSTQNVAYLSLEITLKDLEPRVDETDHMRNWIEKYGKRRNFLTERAFLPHTYTVRLQSGKFPIPNIKDLHNDDAPGIDGYYGLRLVFDQSPYRFPSDWVREENFIGHMKGKTVMFVRQKIKANSVQACCIA